MLHTPQDKDRWFQNDSLAQAVVGDYQRAALLLEELTRDFRAREAMLSGSTLSFDSVPQAGRTGWGPAQEAVALTPAVSVFCLGKFRVEIDGKTLDTKSGGKSLAILKLMVGRGGRLTPKDLLLEALWPDSDAKTANNRLRVAVHGLRRLINGVGDSLAIVSFCNGCYALNPNGLIRNDADEFEALWRRGMRLEKQGHFIEANRAYTSAEALYRGDYMEEDLYEEWALLRRESLRDCYLDLLSRMAAWFIAEDDYGNCISCCHKILAQDACREDAYRMLMRCHVFSGQRSRALRWYDICAATLRRELDVAPSHETAALRRLLDVETT